MAIVIEDVTAKKPPKVKVVLKVMGTQASGFRYRNGALDQARLDDSRELTFAQAKRLAEFYVQLVSETPDVSPDTLQE